MLKNYYCLWYIPHLLAHQFWQVPQLIHFFITVFCKAWISWPVNISNDFIKSINFWFSFYTCDSKVLSFTIMIMSHPYRLFGWCVDCLPGEMFFLLSYNLLTYFYCQLQHSESFQMTSHYQPLKIVSLLKVFNSWHCYQIIF